jgi:hypothetical protein
MRVLVAQTSCKGPQAGEIVIRRREYLRGAHHWRVYLRIVQGAEAAAEAAVDENLPEAANSVGLDDMEVFDVPQSTINVPLRAAALRVDELLPRTRFIEPSSRIEIYALKRT